MATSKNSKISLNFLLVGHTRFAPDRIFGLIKMKYEKADIDTFRDFVLCVVGASPSGVSLAVPTHNPITKVKHVKWNRWDAFLHQFYDPLPHITRYHHFTFREEEITDVGCQTFADAPIQLIKIMRINPANNENGPEEIPPKGLSSQRQWYLYRELRPLCSNQANADKFFKKPKRELPGRRRKSKARGASRGRGGSRAGTGRGRGRGKTT